MLSSRSLISLSQFLGIQQAENVSLILKKCGIEAGMPSSVITPLPLFNLLHSAGPDKVYELIDEICHSNRALRAAITPKYLYDERWNDLERCFLLDGYRLDGHYSGGYKLVALDPTIPAAAPIDDDLSIELTKSNLVDRATIIQLMKNSAADFCKQPPDFNGSLTSARISLETLAKNIAAIYQTTTPMSGDPSKFGAVLNYLRQVALIDPKEESAIAGVYSFVSPGAHVPIGFTEEEMVRLGRSMIAGMCYYLVKKHNG